MNHDRYAHIIIDFDSTICQLESLDELAKIALEENPQKDLLLSEIQQITEAGMVGNMAFADSLQLRLQKLNAFHQHVEATKEILLTHITDSFLKNIAFLQSHSDKILIISGGFKELIYPVTDILGLHRKNVYANELLFDPKGQITGVDSTNFLSQNQGKIKQIQALGLSEKIAVIGDGYTDYEIAENGFADSFYLFTENVSRDILKAKATKVISCIDEFIAIYNNNHILQ